MKILAYEHVTGGGMVDDAQMSALAPEGKAMLRALVDDLMAIPCVEVTVLRDFRLKADLPATTEVVHAGQFKSVFRRAVLASDAVWPIAPEQGDALLRVAAEVLACDRRLLGNGLEAIAIATSKRATSVMLARAGVPVIPVFARERDLPLEIGGIVVKPDDGAGCQDVFLFDDRAALREWLQGRPGSNRIFQPYIRGEARSLSVLCCEGRARLLACNRQKINLRDGAFHFEGVSVNAVADRGGRYAALANAITVSLPGLWGYCGVDFIETDAGPVVIEVNPRLTTSYVGLRRATGANVAQLVLELPGSLDGNPAAEQGSRAIDVDLAHAG